MGKSSKDKRDAYYRLAKEQGWRARKFDLFSDVTRVVDLCAAPGSWSQVLSRVLIKGEKFGRAAWEDKETRMRQNILGITQATVEEKQKSNEAEFKPKKDVKIVAIDLQPMSPLQGIITLRADITHPATVPLLLSALDSSYDPKSLSQQASNPVDLVISDGAPDVTGLHDLDIYVQSQLLFAALNLALCVLRPGGKFVAKIFRGRNVDLLFAQLKIFFERVVVSKPRSSRASSVEAFIVCLNFQPPEGFKASMEDPMGVGDRLSKMVDTAVSQEPMVSSIHSQNSEERTCSESRVETTIRREDGIWETKLPTDEAKLRKSGRWIAPFLACGDLSGYDADASYHLPKDRITLDPVQPPTAPPYKRALEMRKAAGGAYGKTTTGKHE
ncbi:tRNA (uridine-2'-O-)-methyltransferase trm7 [Ciborinia camelliae]|nr:tRNA (uridine-2'-O-)-methyltransferase trm7 [Ciborinia camelliae]